MVMVSGAELSVIGVGVPESVTVKTRLLNVPAQAPVGVPLRTPAVVNLRQDGSVPLVRAHV